MVKGKGDIASVLKDRKDITFFACGVSDSKCTDVKEFEREFNLLIKQNPLKRLVYFSSLSIYDKDTAYTKHKRRMEGAVRTHFKKYCIIRLGNITWGSNPNTVINYFKEAIKKKQIVQLFNEFKYLCSLEEFNYWINRIPDFNTEMNITGERVSVIELYERIENETKSL